MSELVIRNATVVDGTGRPKFVADVAVDSGKICFVGKHAEKGYREINADGLLLTPGWVDIHTHYDGQAIWDELMTPSSWHGVTTAVFGNCGVGFAPVRKGTEKYLINLMEGVEDIPESVLSEGLDFSWQSFPEYLDVLDQKARIMDIGTQIPHAALRFFVMGKRGADHQSEPTDDEIGVMGHLVEEALSAGALGFSTSRTIKHKAGDGSYTPSLTASEPELLGIAHAMRNAGRGVIEVNSDFGDGDFEILREIAKTAKRPLTVLLLQVHNAPNLWKETLASIKNARMKGQAVTGQVGSRPIGVLMGFQSSIHPFINHPLWRSMEQLPHKEKISRITSDEILRKKLICELPQDKKTQWIVSLLKTTFKLDDPTNCEPDFNESAEAFARRNNSNILEVVLSWLLEDEGKALLLHTFENYYHGDLRVIHQLLQEDSTICGLGDAGAHVGFLCDAGSMTSMLDFWVKRRTRGPRLPLEYLVKKQTKDTAETYGLFDRGQIVEGYKADFNLIDFENLRVTKPEVVYDLPAGGKRIQQKAVGYRHTFVSGVEVMVDGQNTGSLPGKLIRGSTNLAI